MTAQEWIERVRRPGMEYRVYGNRLALKYFAGVPQQDGFAPCDFGPGGPGKTRGEILEEYGGYAHVRLFYPFPTADRIEAVYTDECLPGAGDLTQNAPADGARLQLFDEPAAWRTILREGLFAEFCDSFIVEFGGEAAGGDRDAEAGRELIYQKLPANRGPASALATAIYRVTAETDPTAHSFDGDMISGAPKAGAAGGDMVSGASQAGTAGGDMVSRASKAGMGDGDMISGASKAGMSDGDMISGASITGVTEVKTGFAETAPEEKWRAGGKVVVKTPMAPEALGHLREISRNYRRLCEVYDGLRLKINPCRLCDDDGVGERVEFAFERGRTLTSLLDDCMLQDDIDGFYGLVDDMLSMVKEPGVNDAGCLAFCSLDLIFDNFIIDEAAGEPTWTMIDYEWAAEDAELKFLLYRALRQYFLDDHLRGMDSRALYGRALAHYGIDPARQTAFDSREEAFQAGIREGAAVLEPGEVIPFRKLAAVLPDGGEPAELECFADVGSGFSPEGKIAAVSAGIGGGRRRVKITLPAGIRRLRFDPAEVPGVLELNGAHDETGRSVRPGRSNAKKRRGLSYLFLTEDPQLVFKPARGSRELVITYQFVPLSPAAAMKMDAML